MRKNWGPVLAITIGLGFCLFFAWTMHVMASERVNRQTTLEQFNAGDLFRTGLTREEDGEVRLLAVGIAGEWITDTNATGFPSDGRMEHCAVQYNDIIYVIGGGPAFAEKRDIYYSKIITLTHDLENWTQDDSLPTAIYPTRGTRRHACVALNDRIYVIGGTNTNSVYDTVSHAPINSDGSIGSWTTTTALPAARYAPEAVVVDGRIYVVGGVLGGTPQNQVWYAQPDPTTGAISAWQTTASLPETGYFGHRVAAGEGRIYVTGGTYTLNPSSGEFLPYVDFAQPASDGTIASWTRSTDLAANLFAHESLVENGQLFVLAGAINNATAPSDYVGSSLLNTDGTLMGWADTSLIVPARFWHAAVSSTDGWLYIIGGSAGATGPLTDNIINRGATTGAGSFNFANWGTFTSHEIEIDDQYNRTITGMRWSATITDTDEMGLAMEYQYRRTGGLWSAWQGPFDSAPQLGTFTTTLSFDGVAGRYFRYRATLSTTLQATPVLHHVDILFDVPEPPNLSKTAIPIAGSLVQPGERITYTISYDYPDATPLTSVVITDFLPISITVISGSVVGPNPTIGPDWITWDIGELNQNDSGQVSFAVEVALDAPDETVLNNLALITAAEVQDRYSNQVSHTVGEIRYDLSVDKDDGQDTAVPDQTLTYNITYSNTNDIGLAIGDVVLTETLEPAGYLTLTSPGWTLVSSGVYRYELGELPANVPGTLPVEVKVSPSLQVETYQAITNTVKIGTLAAGVDTDLDNNLAQDIDITYGPDLIITNMSLLPPYPGIDQPVRIKVSIYNRGINAVDEFFVVEIYAKLDSFVPAGPPAGPMDHMGGYCGDIVWPGCAALDGYLINVPGLDSGQSATVQFSIDLSTIGTYDFYAQADITFDVEGDPNWGDPWGRFKEFDEANNIMGLLDIYVAEEASGGPVYLPLVFR